MPSKVVVTFHACNVMSIVDKMTLDTLMKNSTFEGKFGTLNYKDEVWLYGLLISKVKILPTKLSLNESQHDEDCISDVRFNKGHPYMTSEQKGGGGPE